MLALLALAVLPVARPTAADRTFRVDPVELHAGKEVPGDEGLALAHGRYTYWFASAASRATFEKDPARYEIQLGGACGRMGPLSGAGRTTIFAVHDGKLYLFASPPCRDGFLKDPSKLLEASDPLPAIAEGSAERGCALLDLALRALGGAEAVDAVTTWSERLDRDVVSGGHTYRVKNRTWIAYPDRVRQEEHWDDGWWGHCADGTGAWSLSGSSGAEPLVPSQTETLRKETGRNLLAVLRRRSIPGAVVAHAGERHVDAVRAELVAIAQGGSTDVLAIDPSTGRILAQSWRGRGPRSAFGDLEARYSDWRAVGKLSLPFTTSQVFDGEPVEGSRRTLDALEIDAEIDPALFRAP